MNCVIMPALNCLALTQQAVEDVLNQSIPVTLLLIDQGSDDEFRAWRNTLARTEPRVLVWSHDPPLPSLSATWNRALRFVWEAGGSHAWVINNDVRLWDGTYQYLLDMQEETGAWFVTATGVTAGQFKTFCSHPVTPRIDQPAFPLPGPDFSCYLITRECHEKYQFDESYVPGYVEDIDFHRRMMLGGDGQRIFGTGLPFQHIGSGTLNDNPKTRLRLERLIEQGSRAHHLRKWAGSGANRERFTIPFDSTSERDGVATHELFERVRNGHSALPEGKEA